MQLLYGLPPRPLRMAATRRYPPDEVINLLARLDGRGQQIWIRVENTNIPVGLHEVRLAAEMATAYHNAICYNAPPDDGWQEETEAMEERALQHMLAPLSDDSADEAQ